jgi:opacity protein-like surface antigen
LTALPENRRVQAAIGLYAATAANARCNFLEFKTEAVNETRTSFDDRNRRNRGRFAGRSRRRHAGAPAAAGADAGEGDAADFQLERFLCRACTAAMDGAGRVTPIRDCGGPTGNFDADGWLLGGLLGVNYQVGQTVWGLEADMNWTDFSGSTSCGAKPARPAPTGSARYAARLGYAVDRFMPYVTGGVAFGKVKAMRDRRLRQQIRASAGPRASAPNMRSPKT